MSGAAKVAIALWAVFALVLFSVTFDVLTRVAAGKFMSAQYHRRVTGVPLETIDNGFRPLMHQAARDAAVWPLLLLALGTGATFAAERHSR